MTHTIYTTSNTSCNNCNFRSKPDYSKILTDLIASDIKKKNTWLSTGIIDEEYIPTIQIKKSSSSTLEDDKFIKAAKFLSNYKKNNDIKSKFILGKTYKLLNGTPIIFYDDEIQIGFDLFSYDDLSDINFIKGMSSNTKKIIIKIFNSGTTNININLL